MTQPFIYLQATSSIFWISALILIVCDSAIVLVLIRIIEPNRFSQIQWGILIAATFFQQPVAICACLGVKLVLQLHLPNLVTRSVPDIWLGKYGNWIRYGSISLISARQSSGKLLLIRRN